MAARTPTFLLSFDFDGTLVHPESDPIFHPALGDMIRGLRQQGAAWVINTGRSLSQTLLGLAQYGVFMEPDYLIARECDIYRPGTFRRWTDYGPWNRQARKAHDRFVKDHSSFFRAMRELAAEHQAEVVEGGQGDTALVARSNASMDQLCEWIAQQQTALPDLGYQRNGIYLRFSHARYSKGSALGELARQLNLTAEQVFAAGDNYNDLSMLHPRYAHRIACPGNALEPIKEHVRSHGGFVASRTASLGMMEALAHFFGGTATD